MFCNTHAMTKILVWNCGNDLTHAEREAKHLESLRSADCEVLVAPPSVEWNGLAAISSASKPTIFHFIGHGDPKGQLVVRENGNRVNRPATDVIRVVRAASASLEGVYLSGCFTARIGPELLTDLPPTAGWAIGTVSEVDDDLAAEFSGRFYDHLIGSAGSPQQAYDVATAYTVADWEEVHHAAWFVRSQLPAVDQMAQTIGDCLHTIFNRPAFKETMRNEVSMTDLDDALQDVSHALGTGQLLSRRTGTVIPPGSFPVEWLQEPTVNDFVEKAVRGISAVRRALAPLREGDHGNADRIIGNAFNFDSSVPPAERMKCANKVDRARNQILKSVNKILIHNNIPPFSLIPDSFSPAEISQAVSRQ